MQTNKPILITLSTLFMLTISILKFTNHPPQLPLFPQTTPLHLHIHKHIQTQTAHTHCTGSLHYNLCLQTLTAILPDLRSKSLPEIISATINQTVNDVRSTDFNVTAIRRKLRNLSAIEIRALDDCHSLFVETVTALRSAVSDLNRAPYGQHSDLQTLLSAAMTNQATCLDGFAVSRSKNKVRRYFHKSVRDIARKVSISLALLKKVNGTSRAKTTAFRRSLLQFPVNNTASFRDVSRQVSSNSLIPLKKVYGTSEFKTTTFSENNSLRTNIKTTKFPENNSLRTNVKTTKFPENNRLRTNVKTTTFPEYGEISGGYPVWLRKKDRALLQAPANDTAVIADLVVAKDGSGNFTKIGDALNAAPNMSMTRFVIYVKAGAYYEYLEVDSMKRMIMFVGDGIGKTLIKGNRSVVDDWTTFGCATVAAAGTNFIAKGITFENFAGTSKHQAVALRSNSDFSVFYQCSFIGYQDTLYVHTFRQFYRECDIYGTVDFIFGNAAVIFQKCNLYARKPDPFQKNVFTAQGRDDPNQNTVISIQECKIAAGSELIPNQTMFKSYLGRPWREYSRTVIMRSYIGDLIDPAGWVEWNGSFGLSTLYYGEFMNRGPGSNTTRRVSWPGYKVIVNATEAAMFTVGSFIQGDQWLNGTGVPYYVGLN